MPSNIRFSWGVILALAFQALANDEFEQRVAPILIKRCVECHNEQNSAGGLNLTAQKSPHQGGDAVMNQHPALPHVLVTERPRQTRQIQLASGRVIIVTIKARLLDHRSHYGRSIISHMDPHGHQHHQQQAGQCS